MKAFKLTSGDIITGTDLKEEPNFIIIENPQIIIPTPNGLAFMPADNGLNKNNNIKLNYNHIVFEFDIKDDVITQLRAEVNGLKVSKPKIQLNG